MINKAKKQKGWPAVDTLLFNDVNDVVFFFDAKEKVWRIRKAEKPEGIKDKK